MSDIEEITNGQILNYHGLEVRKYQLKIADACKDRNSLVVLPTGLGKTIIAVLITSKILKSVPSSSKIIVLAPTRPLINQHYETFLKFLNIPEEQFAVLTGKTLPEKRIDVFHDNTILFYTPQTLRNDLVNKKYDLHDIALIIFDEAHHASGDYPYTMIADEFNLTNPDGIILGLTASPGASKNKINTLCETLHIPRKNIHIRTRKDEDVKTYLKPMDIYKIGVDLTSLMEDIYQMITLVLEERLHYLSQRNFIAKKGENMYDKIIRKDLLKLNSELVGRLQSSGDKTGIYSALSINAQALILYHMLELVEQQGLDVLLDYLNKLNKESKKKNSSKANRILAADGRIKRIHLELKKNVEYSPENLIHPKFKVLEKILIDDLEDNPASRILVFVKLRNSVKNIVKRLKKVNDINPVRFVGQTTKSPDDKGLSQNRQIEILEQFKQGVYNVLVSTNVGEEGLDIAECDVVIFYDVVASEIRYIQRKGRTARHREGKVVILYSKGTRDEIYLRIALSKLSRMNVNLKEPHQLTKSYNAFSKINEYSTEEKFANKISKEVKVEPKKKVSNLITENKHQSRLTSYLEESIESEFSIRFSKLLPMKYGLRKKLHKDNIKFVIVDSDLHIVIYNKVLIQIYDPQNIQPSILLNDIKDFSQIASLVIIVFDFMEYNEKIEGEKRLHKKKLQELGNSPDFQVITIDNEEELYFIIKNIIEASKEN